LVVVTYLDRTSLAFAALQLCRTDWFNAKVYGLVSLLQLYVSSSIFQSSCKSLLPYAQ
jgi:hypothetical protein